MNLRFDKKPHGMGIVGSGELFYKIITKIGGGFWTWPLHDN